MKASEKKLWKIIFIIKIVQFVKLVQVFYYCDQTTDKLGSSMKFLYFLVLYDHFLYGHFLYDQFFSPCNWLFL